MRKMKDSGIEWIGEIPEHWNVHPICSYFTERKNKNFLGLEKNLLSLSYGKIVRKNINSNNGLLPESFNTYNIIEKDDIIIRPTDLQNDKKSLRTAISKEHGIITSAYIAMKTIKNINSEYFYYLLYTYDVMKVFYNMGNGVRQGLNFSEFSKLMIFEPLIEEQQAISAYLYEKCTEIDSLISDIQQQIETLEQYKRSVITEAVTKGLNPNVDMSDSRIEWIGDIPEHWEIQKLKYIAKLSPYCDFSKISDETIIEYLPMEYIKNGHYISNSKKYSEIPKSLTPFQSGDIVFAKVTPCFENGNIAIMDNITSGIGLGSSELYVIRPFAINCMFIFYWLQNSGFIEKAVFSMTGMGGLKRVPSQFINNLSIVLPLIEEQQQIADYLDKKCKTIDKIISEKKTTN